MKANQTTATNTARFPNHNLPSGELVSIRIPNPGAVARYYGDRTADCQWWVGPVRGLLTPSPAPQGRIIHLGQNCRVSRHDVGGTICGRPRIVADDNRAPWAPGANAIQLNSRGVSRDAIRKVLRTRRLVQPRLP